MQIVDVEQNTMEWLKSRSNFIGGSEVPTIMKASPWRTPLQLWEEKLMICPMDHAKKAYIFQKGHQYEEIARVRLEQKWGIKMPSKVVQHSSIPWARVSLDGLNLEHSVACEIKFVGKEDWEDLKKNGTIPDKYYPQLQYQLMTLGFDKILYLGINEKKELASAWCPIDLDYIKKMTQVVSGFWNLVQTQSMPDFVDMDFKKIRFKETQKDCIRVLDIDREIKRLLADRKRLQASIVNKAKSHRMQFDNLVMIRVDQFECSSINQIKGLDHLDHNDIKFYSKTVSDGLKLIVLNKGDIYGKQ